MKEILPVVNEDDEVIGEKERSLVHRDGDLHRVSHVWVYNSLGQILCQKRSDKVEIRPGAWDFPVGGHVTSGASYEETALAELSEELGIKTGQKLEYLFKTRADIFQGSIKCVKFVNSFAVNYEGTEEELTPDSSVAEVRWFTLDELDAIRRGEDTCFEFFGFLTFEKGARIIRELMKKRQA